MKKNVRRVLGLSLFGVLFFGNVYSMESFNFDGIKGVAEKEVTYVFIDDLFPKELIEGLDEYFEESLLYNLILNVKLCPDKTRYVSAFKSLIADFKKKCNSKERFQACLDKLLICAIGDAWLEGVKILVDAGADINCPCEYNALREHNAPLIAAYSFEQYNSKIVDYLVEKGAI